MVALTVMLLSCDKTVNNPETQEEVSHISISSLQGYITEVDSSLGLLAIVYSEEGDTLEPAIVQWFTSDSSKVSVTNEGIVFGVAVGEAVIKAGYMEVESNEITIEVIPNEIRLDSFLTGQSTGPFIEYTDINPDYDLTYGDDYNRQYGIHLDDENSISLDFGIGDVGGNNLNIWFAIEGANEISIAWDEDYTAIADSMIATDFDSTQTDGYPFYYAEYFNRWSKASSRGENILTQSEWINPPVTITYWYKSDAYAYYSPFYGPLINAGESYIVAMYENEYGYPVYIWVSVEFEEQPMRIIIKEYAIAPSY